MRLSVINIKKYSSIDGRHIIFTMYVVLRKYDHHEVFKGFFFSKELKY